jgi:hypothetical protein
VNRFVSWRGAEGAFSGWEHLATSVNGDGSLVLQEGTAQGEALSPVQEGPLRELIVSWNAATPSGSWLEVFARAQTAPQEGSWTPWYCLGAWSAEDQAHRHSVRGQEDATTLVDTDVLKLRRASGAAYQVRIRLHGAGGAGGAEGPAVRAVFATASVPAGAPPTTSAPVLQEPRLLDLPQCSQMVYPDGGNVWCSPTSVSMVLAYWTPDSGPCEPRVRAAVNAVYDRVYQGHGNWPFNTAYAALHGLEASVRRMGSLAEAEHWIEAGVPLVLSYGWRQGELTGAPIASSSGHLVVLAGFDRSGDPIVHDPAAPRDSAVRRTYRRSEIERLWLSRSAGTAYAIHPPGWPVPT